MKKDLTVAAVSIVLIFAAVFGLANMRAPLPLTPTHPFSTSETVAAIPTAVPGRAPVGNVVMRVNGEPITETEFNATFASLPQDMQQQFATEQGKAAFAEQLLRMKLLEQEARRMKLENDPNVAGQLAAGRTEILANAAGTKLIDKVPDAAVQKFYNDNQSRLQTADLSHIVVAYQGGAIPPKNGGAPPDERTAANKALQIYQQLKEGASFAELAKKESDDTASAARGGSLGEVAPGMLPQELAVRVFALKEGEISTAIPSRYGIHIFKMGKRHTQPLASLKPQIEARVKQEQTMRRIEELRKAAKVELDPKFFPPTARPPA